MNRLAILLLALACLVSHSEADEPRDVTEQQLTFFETKIRPVLVEHYYECHAAGAKIVQGGLRVDHRAGLLAMMAQRMGVETDKFGDNNKVIEL